MSTPRSRLFEPLLPSPASTPSDAAETRPRVVSQPANAQPFKPFLRPGEALSPSAAPPPVACGHPTVTVQREHDQVTQIRIQCTCGQVIELSCVY